MPARPSCLWPLLARRIVLELTRLGSAPIAVRPLSARQSSDEPETLRANPVRSMTTKDDRHRPEDVTHFRKVELR